MKAGAFDPAREPVPLVPGLRVGSDAASSSEASDGRVRFILQFEEGVTPDLLFALQGEGIGFERYLPDGGIIAAAEPRDVPASAGSVGARALLPLHTGFKLDRALWGEALSGQDRELIVSVLVFDTPGAGGAVARHGTVLAFDGRMAIVRTNSKELIPLASTGDVEWVEARAAPAPILSYTTRIVGARQGSDGAFEGDGRAVWAYNNTTDSFSGVDGRGITIAIADSGIDLSHPDFDGRVVAYFDYNGDGSRCDCEQGFPHGTHVAGIAAGNGSWREEDTNRTDGFYAGVAPGALLVAQEVFESLFMTPTEYSQDAYSAGSFVSSNSWVSSGGGDYTSMSEEYDALVLDANGRDSGAPQMSYIFGAGNWGPGPYTVAAPSTGKNVISVGATGNIRSSSPDTVVAFSSRGPTTDGRLKPDLVAPGEDVVSARGNINDTGCWGDGGCSYWSASGTSMSTPVVSGAAALVAAAFQQREGRLPSAAMVKALLIAGATPLPGYAYPGFDQGWGRINVSRTINEDASYRHLAYDEGPALSLTSGRSSADFKVLVRAGEELRVVLVWSDVPGTTSSSKALINDLDLVARAPDGTTYFGNSLVGGFSVSDVTRDTGNNTEVVRFRAPTSGGWTFSVRASVIPSGSQQFALVVTGNVTDRWVSLSPKYVTVSPTSPKEDDPALVTVSVFNGGTLYSGPLRVVGTLEGEEGNVTQEVEVLEVSPGDDFPAFFWFAPRRGDHTFRFTIDPGGTSRDVDTQDNSGSTSFFVKGYEIDLTPIKNATLVAPQASESVSFQVVNRGNVPDTVSVESTASPGWSITLSLTTGVLAAGEATFISGSITAPSRALEGEVGEFTVRAVSAGNASRAGALYFSVPIASVPASRLLQPTSAAAIDPGGLARFDYAVENSGNTALHLRFNASFVPTPAPANWSVTPPSHSLVLAPYTRADLSINVAAPPEALASELQTVQVTVDSTEEGSSTALLFRLFVNRTTGFTLVAEQAALSVDPGSEVQVPVRVQNLGNARETCTLSVAAMPGTSSGVLFELGQGSLSVAPFGEAVTTLTVTVPPSAPAGNASARLSLITPSGENIGQVVRVSVGAVHDVAVEVPARVVAFQGATTVAVVSLENLGNVDESVALSVDRAPAGITVAGWSGPLTLARGEVRTLSITVLVATTAAPGLVDVALLVEPARGEGVDPMASALHLDVRAKEAASSSFVPGVDAAAAVLAMAIAGAAVACVRKVTRRPF